MFRTRVHQSTQGDSDFWWATLAFLEAGPTERVEPAGVLSIRWVELLVALPTDHLSDFVLSASARPSLWLITSSSGNHLS